MSFINKIKCAFGFSDEADDSIIDDDPDVQQVTVATRIAEPLIAPANDTVKQTREASVDDMHPSIIFERVIAMFNEALPDFLQKSVDTEAQRRALFNALDADMKAYLTNIRERAEQECQRHFADERTKLQANIREMESRYREFEEMRSEMNNKQLSNDRQRRTLNERIHSLETQIAEMHAEQEQLQLENKSLINKVKVASVYEKDNTEMVEENKKLQLEINRLRQLQVRGESADDDSVKKLSQELEQRSDELKTALEALELARKDIEDKEHTSKTLENEVAAGRKEAEKLQKQVSQLKEELESVRTEQNDEDKEAMAEQLRLIEEQVSKFEEVSAKKDQRIAKLKEQLEENGVAAIKVQTELAKKEKERVVLELKVQEYEIQIADLERVRANNIEQQIRGEKKLRDEIDTLKKTIGERDQEIIVLSKKLKRVDKGKGQSYGQRPKTDLSTQQVTPIEDILSETDWVISPSSLKSKDHNNKQEKGRNQRPDNDSQLSLF